MPLNICGPCCMSPFLDEIIRNRTVIRVLKECTVGPQRILTFMAHLMNRALVAGCPIQNLIHKNEFSCAYVF
jgi:hypothetical protein